MTLPMLAENYQRRVIETRLKKFYTTFNQAILRSIDVNGPYEGWIYWNIGKKDENGNYISAVVDNDRSFSFYLRPYLSIIQTQKVIYTNGEENVLYYFSDGSAFMFHENWNRLIRYYPKDPVRCLKQAAINRCGVCEFRFHFNPLEKGSGWKYLKGKGLEPALFCWDGKVDTLYNHSTYGCSVGDGVYCAALIQYNNWEFPPDYPRKIRY